MTPEKIYIHTTHHGELLDTWGTEKADQWPEYIRKDIHDKAIAENEALLKEVIAFRKGEGKYNLSHLHGQKRSDTSDDLWYELESRIAKAIREGE